MEMIQQRFRHRRADRITISDDADSLCSLPRLDYSDAFRAATNRVQAPEAWARAVLEGPPAPIPACLHFLWAAVVRLDLAPRADRSPSAGLEDHRTQRKRHCPRRGCSWHARATGRTCRAHRRLVDDIHVLQELVRPSVIQAARHDSSRTRRLPTVARRVLTRPLPLEHNGTSAVQLVPSRRSRGSRSF
jgi:hypothetical protein